MYTPQTDDRPTYPSTELPAYSPTPNAYSPVPPASYERPRGNGRRIVGSVAGLVLAAGAYAGWQVVRQQQVDRAEDTAQRITEQVLGDVEQATDDIFSIGVGDCLATAPDGSTVNSMPTLPCSAPHVYEVYSQFDVPDSAYPGAAALTGSADSGCDAAFAGFVGRPSTESALAYGFLYPSEQSWGAGDRTVVCFVGDPSVPVTAGSLAGANR